MIKVVRTVGVNLLNVSTRRYSFQSRCFSSHADTFDDAADPVERRRLARNLTTYVSSVDDSHQHFRAVQNLLETLKSVNEEIEGFKIIQKINFRTSTAALLMSQSK